MFCFQVEYNDEFDDSPYVPGGAGSSKDGATKPNSSGLKVDMQVLNMSQESQDMIVSMMKELYGDTWKLRDCRSYKDNRRGLGRFRVRDNQLIVRGFEKLEQVSPEDVASAFAKNQLTTYGFNASRAQEALVASEVSCL